MDQLLPEESKPSVQDMEGVKEQQEAIEKKLIVETLQRFKYNKSKTAEFLGIDRKTLYQRLKKI
ncbi:helix-turn-helix domain-containing protein [Nitritalea halalkaliphila]|uniref:helix-turn-helix domain-containing protein n=1 Tax=Nitritalea halalkaliphila TaxID=590849 RepID=UPI000314ED29|nr:helix-turn-helix domain-containing protein [Nitritalea halalkaliphila]